MDLAAGAHPNSDGSRRIGIAHRYPEGLPNHSRDYSMPLGIRQKERAVPEIAGQVARAEKEV